MVEVGQGIPSWDEAMRHAAAWLAKLEKDSGRKLGEVSAMVQADAEAVKAWVAFATELTNRSRSGPSDTP
jgi:hypothetical protein